MLPDGRPNSSVVRSVKLRCWAKDANNADCSCSGYEITQVLSGSEVQVVSQMESEPSSPNRADVPREYTGRSALSLAEVA